MARVPQDRIPYKIESRWYRYRVPEDPDNLQVCNICGEVPLEDEIVCDDRSEVLHQKCYNAYIEEEHSGND